MLSVFVTNRLSGEGRNTTLTDSALKPDYFRCFSLMVTGSLALCAFINLAHGKFTRDNSDLMKRQLLVILTSNE